MTTATGTIETIDVTHARVLTPELRGKVRAMRMRYAMWESHGLLTAQDQGPSSVVPPIPRLNVRRSRLYTGTRETGSYNHHAQIAKFRGRYYFAWANGMRDELCAGQRILLSSSSDAIHWSPARCIVPGDVEKEIAQSCAGLYAGERELVLYCRTESAFRDPDSVGMRRVDPQHSRIDTYVSTDGERWELAEQGIILGSSSSRAMLFEAPRLTQKGTLMAGGFVDGPVAYHWDPSAPAAKPEVVRMPLPSANAVFHHGESSWYQTDAGLIVVFWRDEGASLHLYVSYSADGGDTWTAPMISDFPDSMSRIYAGRLADGRFFLVGNSYPKLLDRTHLMISISTDGLKFDRMYTLLDDPTAQRLAGFLKNDGYQYPCVLVDGPKLLIAYSINKEDMECGVVSASDL